MPGPLLFFIFIIVIDLILKSAKDKQKIEEAKKRRAEELNKQPRTSDSSRPMADLKRILKEEVEKERQRELARRQGSTTKNNLPNKKRSDANTTDKKPDIKDISWEIRETEKTNSESKKSDIELSQHKVENKERSLKEDMLRGIIFSEILSEPKSLQNKRRSL